MSAPTKKVMLGWHWLSKDRSLRFGDKAKVRTGRTLSADGALSMCVNGMHASPRALDALQYAPGPIACRVELIGERIDGGDKSVARSRRVLWMVDATKTLHEFACWCAEAGLKREREAGREPDKRSWDAIRVKRRWLRGLASDKELDAARDAAWDAAWATARARDAARAAAWAAARDAAWAAARDAARDAQNAKLEAMLNALHRR